LKQGVFHCCLLLCSKKEPLVFWFCLIVNSGMNLFFWVWFIFQLDEAVVHLSGFFRLQKIFEDNNQTQSSLELDLVHPLCNLHTAQSNELCSIIVVPPTKGLFTLYY
jgi:hypothetical protein